MATGVLGAGWLLSETAFKSALAPSACRWCARNGLDDAVRAVFNPDPLATGEGVRWADTASNVTAFAALPLATLGVSTLLSWREDPDGPWLSRAATDALLVLEATFAALTLNQVVKFSVGRIRPFVTSLPDSARAGVRDPSDNFLSFYSGHSTWSFALATAAGTVATLRWGKSAWVVWLCGLPLAAATAMLRLAADKHWFTDVLLGTASGAAFGAGLPLLFHRPAGAPARVSLVPAPGGVGLLVRLD